MLFAETVTGLSSLKLPMQNIERVKTVQHATVFHRIEKHTDCSCFSFL